MHRVVTAELQGQDLDEVVLRTGRLIAEHLPMPRYETVDEMLRLFGGARTPAILATRPVEIRIEGERLGSFMLSAYTGSGGQSISFSVDSEHELLQRLYADVVIYYGMSGLRISERDM